MKNSNTTPKKFNQNATRNPPAHSQTYKIPNLWYQILHFFHANGTRTSIININLIPGPIRAVHFIDSNSPIRPPSSFTLHHNTHQNLFSCGPYVFATSHNRAWVSSRDPTRLPLLSPSPNFCRKEKRRWVFNFPKVFFFLGGLGIELTIITSN